MTALNQIPLPELFVSSEAAEKLSLEGARLPGWTLSARQLCDLELLMNGAFFPLKGFMSQADCDQVQREDYLTSGAPWPAAVTLTVDDEFGNRIEPGDDIGLWEGDLLLAIMSVTDHWRSGGAICLGGKVKGLRAPVNVGLTPNNIRSLIREYGWQVVKADFGGEDSSDAPGDVLRIFPDLDQEAELPTGNGGDQVIITRVDLCSRPAGPAKARLQEIVARNYGATIVHVSDT